MLPPLPFTKGTHRGLSRRHNIVFVNPTRLMLGVHNTMCIHISMHVNAYQLQHAHQLRFWLNAYYAIATFKCMIVHDYVRKFVATDVEYPLDMLHEDFTTLTTGASTPLLTLPEFTANVGHLTRCNMNTARRTLKVLDKPTCPTSSNPQLGVEDPLFSMLGFMHRHYTNGIGLFHWLVRVCPGNKVNVPLIVAENQQSSSLP